MFGQNYNLTWSKVKGYKTNQYFGQLLPIRISGDISMTD